MLSLTTYKIQHRCRLKKTRIYRYFGRSKKAAEKTLKCFPLVVLTHLYNLNPTKLETVVVRPDDIMYYPALCLRSGPRPILGNDVVK